MKWWKWVRPVLGFLASVLAFLTLRKITGGKSDPPVRDHHAADVDDIVERYDDAVEKADDDLADRLSSSGDDRYADAAEWARRRRAERNRETEGGEG